MVKKDISFLWCWKKHQKTYLVLLLYPENVLLKIILIKKYILVFVLINHRETKVYLFSTFMFIFDIYILQFYKVFIF